VLTSRQLCLNSFMLNQLSVICATHKGGSLTVRWVWTLCAEEHQETSRAPACTSFASKVNAILTHRHDRHRHSENYQRCIVAILLHGSEQGCRRWCHVLAGLWHGERRICVNIRLTSGTFCVWAKAPC